MGGGLLRAAMAPSLCWLIKAGASCSSFTSSAAKLSCSGASPEMGPSSVARRSAGPGQRRRDLLVAVVRACFFQCLIADRLDLSGNNGQIR